MPDIKEIIGRAKAGNANAGQNLNPDPSDSGNELLQGSASVASDPNAVRSEILTDRLMGSEYNELNKPAAVAEDGWTADRAYQNFFSKAGDNVLYGLGTMASGLGDVAQAIEGLVTDDWSGNAISDVLHEWGQTLEDNNQTYVSKEMQDPKFSLFGTYMNPEFWAVHGARFVPQLVEILATAGAAGAIRKGAQKGAQAVLKDQVGKLGRKTTKGAFKGGRAVNEVKEAGESLFAKMMTDQGKFTKSFSELMETATAGTLTNMRVSLANAGEMYNTYKGLTDENGNPLFTEDELGEMSAGAFTNNIQYLGMDILSWGLTFGRGNMLKNLGLNPRIKSQGVENVKAAFIKSTSPIIRKAARLSGKAVAEGFEETVQESWEEWAKMESYRDKTGSLEGYQGKVSQEYKRGLPGFYEFMKSSDSEAIRAISFGMGAMAGGAFNAKILFNKEADRARQMRDRVYALEQQSNDLNGEEKKMLNHHIHAQIAELAMEGKGEAFAGFINRLVDRNVISEEEVEYYGDLHDTFAQEAENIKTLNTKGKKALIMQAAQQRYFEDSAQAEQEAHNRRLQYINDNVFDPEAKQAAIEKENKAFGEIMQGLAYGIARTIKNKQNILAGRKAEDVKTKDNDVLKNTDLKTDGVVVPEAFKNNEQLRQIYEQTYNSLLNPQEKGETSTENPSIQEAIDDPEGFMSALIAGEDILIDDMPATITGVGTNAEGIQDNFNYEMPGEVDEETGEAEEPTKGNIRLTKKGTYFDDRTSKVSQLARALKNIDPKDDPKNNPPGPPPASAGMEARTDDAPKSAMERFFQDYSDIEWNPKSRNLTKKAFKNFMDTGKIDSGIITSIAGKMIDGKRLSKEEEAVRLAHSEPVEKMLNAVRVQEETQNKSKNLDEKTQNYIEKASERTTKSKTLQEPAGKSADKTTVQSITEKAKQKASEVFQSSKKHAAKAQSEFRKIKDKVTDKINQVKDENPEPTKKTKAAIQKANEATGKFLGDVQKKVRKISNSAVEAGQQYLHRVHSRRKFESEFAVVEFMATNEALEQMFPDTKPRVYVLDNLYNGIGVRGVGYSVAGAIFIDENNWKQDKVLMHEASHIYFGLTADQPETKALMQQAMKNEPLVKKITEMYDDQIYFRQYQTPHNFDGASRVITKGQLLKDYDGMDVIDRDMKIMELIGRGEIKPLPLNQQPVIMEEVFVATIEGDLSNRYNRYFGDKFDYKRKGAVKKWWAMLKRKAVQARAANAIFEKNLLKSLSKEDAQLYQTSKEYVLNNFRNETRGIRIDAAGRLAKIENDTNKVAGEMLDVRERRIKNQEEHVGKPDRPNEIDRAIMAEQAAQEDLELTEGSYDPDKKFQQDSLKYIQRAGKLIRQFNTAYGIAMAKRYFYKNKGNVSDWKRMPVYDGDQLFIKLNDLAHEATSADDYIRTIENSEIEELFEFNEFLNDTRPDKEALLASLYHLNRNQHFVNGVKVFVNNDGMVEVQQSTNFTEKTIIENQKYNLIKIIGSYFKSKNDKKPTPEFAMAYDEYKQAARNIRNNAFTNNDIRTVLSFFGGPKIKVDKIIDQGFINIKGKTYNVNDVVYGFLTSPYGIGGSVRGQGQQTANTVYVDEIYMPKSRNIRKGVLDFMEALVATNRPFTAEYTVTDANGNLKPARQVNNALFTITKGMRADALEMSKDKFLTKYGQVTKKLKTGRKSNQLLSKIYDDVVSGNEIAINTFEGTINQQTGNRGTIKESNATEQSFTEFATYMASGYSERGSGKSTYLMELGRFSDSPRSFIMEVPRIKLTTIGKKTAAGAFKIDPKKPAIIASYEINKNAGFEGTIGDYVKSLEGEIRAEYKFLESQSEYATGIRQMSQLFDQNGKLNPKGRRVVAEYVLNQHLNGSYFMEAFLPSYKGANVVKRAKSLTSPQFSVGANTRLEAIPIVDQELNGLEATDGAMYMRTQDIQRVRKLGGNLMDIGYGIKGLHSGVEYNNSKFAGKNVYNKGYIFELNDDIVAKNPELKGVYDLLNARAENFEKTQGYYEDDLASDIISHLPYAYHISADKAKMLPGSFRGEVAEAFNLENIGNNEASNKYLDNLYYGKKGTFVGLSGENFGAQLTMDKIADTSNVSVQMMKGITTNATVTDNIETAERLQGYLTDVMQDELAKIDEVFRNGTAPEIRALIKRYMNIAEMDPIQAQAIEVDNLSFNTPELRIIARNQVANIVRMKGNKIVAPGTMAQQKPDHYAKPYNTGGTDKLAFYSRPSQDEVADMSLYETGRKPETKVFRYGARPSEAVVPEYMIGHGVQKRTYFTPDQVQNYSKTKDVLTQDGKKVVYIPKSTKDKQADLKAMFKVAKEVAAKRGTKVGIVYKDGKVHGFYAEGTRIMATRIPAHGPQSTGVFEVIDFNPGESSNIQVPAEFSLNTTGGDFDGDTLFIQHGANRNAHPQWKKFIQEAGDYWLTDDMQNEVKLAINHKEMVEQAKRRVDPIGEENVFFTPNKRRQDFHNTRSTSESIGIVASAHALIGMLSAYNVNFGQGFSINGEVRNTFQDVEPGSGSRTINSANLFQIILDNAKDQSAQILGINNQTATIATTLINLGYDLGDIAVILRSPVVEKYVELKAAVENNFSDRYKRTVLPEVKKVMNLNITGNQNNINTNEDINSSRNQEAIFRLLENAEKISQDFFKLNGLLSQHNKMEINPFQLQEEMANFEKAINNEGNAILQIPEGFKTNPIVMNYQNTAQTLADTLQKIDPVYRPNSSRLYEVVVNGAPSNMTKAKKEKLYNLVELFHTARSLGFNNIPVEHLRALTKAGDPKNIFDRLQAHMDKMSRNIIKYNPVDPKDSVSELQASLLFSRLLNISPKGRQQFIKLNTGFYKENIDASLKQRASQEFAALPTDLKNDLILYDMMQTGFKSGSSIFPIMPDDFRQTVSWVSDDDIQTKDTSPVDPKVMQKLLKAILQENPELSFIGKSKTPPFVRTKKGEQLNPQFVKANPKIRENLLSGKPFFFAHNGMVHYFRGGKKFLSDSNLLAQNSENTRFDAAIDVARRHMTDIQLTPSQFNEGIIAIPDGDQTPYYEWNRDETVKSWDEHLEDANAGMEARQGRPETNYWAYHYKLDRAGFDSVMNYDMGVTEDQKSIMYQGYEDDFAAANKIYKEINEGTVKTMTDAKLAEVYEIYGMKNKFAYAKVLRPIVLEIANRNMQEQVLEYNGKAYDGKDITPMQKMMMSNNVPSNNPAAQATVRQLERAYKEYQVERTRMLTKINNATNDLYQEKFGFKIRGGNWIDFLKSIYYSFSNMLARDRFYKTLYGNIIDIVKSKGPEGQDQTLVKFKPKAKIEEDFANGNISQAEYNFYKAATDITEEMKPYVVRKGSGRADYIPHVAPDLMEKLSTRGLLGALVHGKTINEQIYDVKMDFTNPITGEAEKQVTFKYIQDVYNAISVNKNAPLKYSADFAKLKKQAYDLYRTGKNSDGSPIEYTEIAVGSAIGDVFMNEFSGRNGVSAKDLPSLDLNKAFNDYVTSALFVHGNGKFAGMKKLLPAVDGVIAQANRDNNPNMEAYMDGIWRNYFLKGSKKSIEKNSSALLAVGVTSDDVVDFLTKGSLFYWLGWKGLAIGKGLYAVGNVLVGKYHNVKNRSGKEWVKGEQRFWFGKSGKFDIKDPLKGSRETAAILKNAGFLDINIYDEVHASKKNSFDTVLSNIALAPMIKSEQWIQGVHFLGMLTDQEWDHLKNGGRLSWDRLNYLEDEVKKSHGKGYQPTDQRMLQMYSWGRAVLQFSRYLPTMAYDRLGKKDIDRYGKIHVGAYRAVWEPIQKMITGNMTTAEFKQYYDSLDPEEKRRFDAGIKGFGMMTLLVGAQQAVGHSEYADDLFWDANAIFDYDKLKWKTTPPQVAMIEQLTNF